jgi:hypothetical protein
MIEWQLKFFSKDLTICVIYFCKFLDEKKDKRMHRRTSSKLEFYKKISLTERTIDMKQSIWEI